MSDDEIFGSGEEEECDLDSDLENQDEEDLTTTTKTSNVDSFKGIDKSKLFKTLRERYPEHSLSASEAKGFNRETLINLLVNGIGNLDSQTWRNENIPYEPLDFLPKDVSEEIGPDATPLEIWRHFFDDDLLDLIVRETNIYIKHRDRLDQCHKLFHGQDINKDILLVFFSALMSTCFFKLPSIPLYWENSFFNIHAVNSLISAKQFEFIITNLHFSEPINRPKRTAGRPPLRPTYARNPDPIYKIRKVAEALRTNFKKVYSPTCELAIDESIVPNKKRAGSLLQHTKSKPDRSGYKIWKLVDANGYLFDFNIYLGKY